MRGARDKPRTQLKTTHFACFNLQQAIHTHAYRHSDVMQGTRRQEILYFSQTSLPTLTEH